MTYYVCNMDDVRKRAADYDDDRDCLEVVLNQLEDEGMFLKHVVPQYQQWNGSGEPVGMAETLFVFHRPTV
ncbi:hypothetical protein ACFP3Q_03910 [Nocardioides sp. GCM10027113]|uniref:hypothetical protein n=1 Tax=unclassified Nocardioides TaxID=2615069 RepID=UPI003607308C